MNMDMYTAVRDRISDLLYERKISIHKLSMMSAVPPSTIKNILYGKSMNPGIVTLKMLCDGLEIRITDFFDTDVFRDLEQEIR